MEEVEEQNPPQEPRETFADTAVAGEGGERRPVAGGTLTIDFSQVGGVWCGVVWCGVVCRGD